MNNCYSCNVLLDDKNISEEHIINNSIGGRRKSTRLLCKACNEKFGGTIDRTLQEQLGGFTDLLGVGRQRKKENVRIAMKADDGTIKYVGPKLKPLNRLSYTLPGNKTVVLYAPEDKFEELKEKKIAELSKKFKVDFVPYTELPDKTTYHIQNALSNEEFDIGFGGPEFFRSVSKMAVNYYLWKDYDIKYCRDVIAVINGEKENTIAYFYYPKEVHYQIHTLAKDEVSHIIHIRGDQSRKMLYAYVELFSMQNVLVKFDMNYDGPEINDTYCLDLLNGIEIKKDVTIKLGKHHFEILHLIAREGQKERQSKYRRIELFIQKIQMT